jgi:hypothetical protein
LAKSGLRTCLFGPSPINVLEVARSTHGPPKDGSRLLLFDVKLPARTQNPTRLSLHLLCEGRLVAGHWPGTAAARGHAEVENCAIWFAGLCQMHQYRHDRNGTRYSSGAILPVSLL